MANGGVWVQPHLVAQVAGRARRAAEKRRILSRGVASQLATMLTGVVSEQGTGMAAAIPGYHVAGKTGTAAKPLSGGRGYSTSRYVASFVGFVPATRPRLVILVTVDEPTTIWGGVVAAPAFQELARFALQYLEVPTGRPSRRVGLGLPPTRVGVVLHPRSPLRAYRRRCDRSRRESSRMWNNDASG